MKTLPYRRAGIATLTLPVWPTRSFRLKASAPSDRRSTLNIPKTRPNPSAPATPPRSDAAPVSSLKICVPMSPPIPNIETNPSRGGMSATPPTCTPMCIASNIPPMMSSSTTVSSRRPPPTARQKMKIPLARSIWNTRSPSDWGFYGGREALTATASQPCGGPREERHKVIVDAGAARDDMRKCGVFRIQLGHPTARLPNTHRPRHPVPRLVDRFKVSVVTPGSDPREIERRGTEAAHVPNIAENLGDDPALRHALG